MANWDHEPRANPVGARSVLDCGDGVCGVAALGRVVRVGGEPQQLERGPSQSGDCADSVTALQNLAAVRRFMCRRASVLECASAVALWLLPGDVHTVGADLCTRFAQDNKK